MFVGVARIGSFTLAVEALDMTFFNGESHSKDATGVRTRYGCLRTWEIEIMLGSF